jgi:hypothetical protein
LILGTDSGHHADILAFRHVNFRINGLVLSNPQIPGNYTLTLQVLWFPAILHRQVLAGTTVKEFVDLIGTITPAIFISASVAHTNFEVPFDNWQLFSL